MMKEYAYTVSTLPSRARVSWSAGMVRRRRVAAVVHRGPGDVAGEVAHVAAHTGPGGDPGGIPPEDWVDAIPRIHIEITRKQLRARRHRSCPRAVKRARHNSYRVKKPGEPASIRHNGPATILIHRLIPRAA
jgi:hypothetical protein